MKAHQTALEKLTGLTQEGVMASMHALTASDLRINWFETGFESLPKASKFIQDAHKLSDYLWTFLKMVN
jgi:hypothetical protein